MLGFQQWKEVERELPECTKLTVLNSCKESSAGQSLQVLRRHWWRLLPPAETSRGFSPSWQLPMSLPEQRSLCFCVPGQQRSPAAPEQEGLNSLMKTSVYRNIQITSSHSCTTNPTYLRKDSVFSSRTVLQHSVQCLPREAFSKQISTGWLARALGVGVKKLRYLISTTAKVHSCQALKLQGQPWKGSWWGPAAFTLAYT